jgi:methylglutamate dehydrogenase subunit D
MFESRSPLASRLAAGDRDGADGRRGVRFTEIRGREILQIGVFSGRSSAVSRLIEPLAGTALPDSSRVAAHAGQRRLYRIAADQYWIVSTGAGIGRALEEALPPDAATLTVLSGARVCLKLDGRAARDVLAHHVALDLDLREFPPGRFAQTGIDHAGVLLDRCGDECFEIYLLSTFAASAWDVLVDSALPYGYSVGVESAADGGAGAGPT